MNSTCELFFTFHFQLSSTRQRRDGTSQISLSVQYTSFLHDFWSGHTVDTSYRNLAGFLTAPCMDVFNFDFRRSCREPAVAILFLFILSQKQLMSQIWQSEGKCNPSLQPIYLHCSTSGSALSLFWVNQFHSPLRMICIYSCEIFSFFNDCCGQNEADLICNEAF